jgi:small subunit ribosomal protein S6
MRRYETFVIIDSDLSQNLRDQVIQRVEELISQMDGFLVFTDDWGERKLAYDIKKRGRGYYVRFDYCGLSPLVNEIERFFRIDDRALKYMTVLLDKVADLEKIKAEKAAAESKAEIEKAPEEVSLEVAPVPVKDTAPDEKDTQADVAPASDESEVEDTAPVEKDTQADVAPTSDESDSAADTTPLKNPEEA